jgi:DNA helicase-2/ATP-dependent DNA helicase PcrA
MEVVVLEDNYRSTQQILDCSTSLINFNKDRLVTQIPGLTKKLKARNKPYSSSTVAPSIVCYHNCKHEELGVVNEVEKLRTEGVPLNDIAIIYLKHKQAEEVIALMERKGIPYNVIKKTNILHLPLINNLVNILFCIQLEAKRPYSGDYLLFEIMHYRYFGLSPRNIAKLAAHSSRKKGMHLRELSGDQKLLSEILPESKKQFQTFSAMLDTWIAEVHNSTLQKVVEKVINSSGLLRDVMNAPDKTWQMQVLTTFFDFIKEESLKNPRITLSGFLDTLEKMKEHNITLSINKTVFEENGVNCTTAHSAKGLEFEYVFLMGCTHNEWGKKGGNQYAYSLPDTVTGSVEENLAEALRRVFYVAITRARQYLEISYPGHNNKGKKLEKANFVAEIEHAGKVTMEERQMDTASFTQLSLEQLTEPQVPSGHIPEDDFINSLLEKYRMSVTHLNKYLSCPVSFYYESILRVPSAKTDYTAFGTAVHFALKRLFDKMLKTTDNHFPPIKEFTDAFTWEMERNRASFSKEQFQRRKELAEELLPNYYKKYVDTWNKVVLCEYNIKEVEMNGIPLNGKLDKLEFNGRDVNVVDYKTGKVANGKKKLQRPSEKNPKGGDYWRQVVFYKILMDEVRPKQWTMTSGEIDFVEKGDQDFEKVKVTVTREDIVIVKEQIRQVYDSIMNHEFEVGCGKEDCHWCNFVQNQFVSDAAIGVNEEFEV